VQTLNQQLTGDRFRLQYGLDRRTPSGFTRRILPANLLAALWMQFGDAVNEDQHLRSCETCERWFEVSQKKYRKSRIYCSEACRSSAYRSRKDKAMRMAASGKSVKEIAKALNSTIATVKGWIAQGKT